jgi:hypothetical protein
MSQTRRLAIWSLVFGITGILLWLFWGCVLSIAAVVCGHKALARLKTQAGQLTGRGFAKAGLILGYIGILSFLLWAAGFYIWMVVFKGRGFQH